MHEWRRRGIGTPAGWYTLIGVVLLAASIWVPFATAERSARVEQRADQMAGLLLEAARPLAVSGLRSTDAPVILARFHALALRDGVHVNDLEVLDEPLPGTVLSLVNKHYVFHVAESPLDESVARGPDTVLSSEVLAWPLSNVGPGHGVFFYPDDSERAYTRNLSAGFHGAGPARPRPGIAHRRDLSAVTARAFYRSSGDERWILY